MTTQHTDRELMQQALEAILENRHIPEGSDDDGLGEVITALRERLAHCDRCGKKLGGPDHIHTCSPQQPVFHLRSHGDVSSDEIERLAQDLIPQDALFVSGQMGAHVTRVRVEQPVQEPVAWTQPGCPGEYVSMYRDEYHTIPLYTAPQPREWQGLTDEEMRQLQDANWTECEGGGYDWNTFAFARSIEAKLKEKNT